MLSKSLLAVLLPLFAVSACGPRGTSRAVSDTTSVTGAAVMPKHIIRTIRTAHCARGPQLCRKCRDMDAPAICLLDVDPPNQGREARRTIEIEVGGRKEWREFDVVKTFADETEARKYAAENGIVDVDLTR